MPAKNSQKQYVDYGYYHIYNRGVEKRIIFEDSQDYAVFLSYLKEYLLPKDKKSITKKISNPDISSTERDKLLKALRMNNFAGEVSLHCYCLMPNHFHLLIHQRKGGSIDVFMNSLSTRYSMYFNRKYHRIGPLYQGVYKAVLVTSEEQLLQLSRYIHRNPLVLQGVALQTLSNQHSSYAEYVNLRKKEWLQANELLAYFSKTNSSLSYQSFVEQKEDIGEMQDLLLDAE